MDKATKAPSTFILALHEECPFFNKEVVNKLKMEKYYEIKKNEINRITITTIK